MCALPVGDHSFEFTSVGRSTPVFTSKLGSRCLGQGNPGSFMSCGNEYRKLTTCGAKNTRRVSLKWPSTPATAKVMPAK